MAGTVKLAVAGAGKTRTLGKTMDPNSKNLFITFTNQNVSNIVNAIKYFNGGDIPANTLIMTYDRFLYHWLIRPFEKSFFLLYSVNFRSKGVEIIDPPEFDRYDLGNGYIKKDKIGHYFSDKTNKFYVNRMSELYVSQSQKFKKKIRTRIETFVDNIYVDEFQDFSEKDFDLLIDLTRCKSLNIEMVGDYYQSLVTKVNFKHSKRPYKTYGYDDFKKMLTKKNIVVDENSLISSKRVPEKTCQFIIQKLGIRIKSSSKSNGKVIILSDIEKATDVMHNKNIVKLFYSNAVKGMKEYTPNNKWGYSKGDTYNEVCVILTDSLKDITGSKILKFKKKVQTQHILYVALTRSRGNTYLLTNKLYKQIVSLDNA